METVEVFVVDAAGNRETIELPTDMALSLMEGLKGSGYPVQATCGGMALCATCRVEVVEGLDNLDEQGDDELDMLDTLPDTHDNHRLACQIKIHDNVNGLVVKLDPAEA